MSDLTETTAVGTPHTLTAPDRCGPTQCPEGPPTMPVISPRRESAICEACGKPVRLINLDKAMGLVGQTMGWVHVSGWARHRPVVTEDDS